MYILFIFLIFPTCFLFQTWVFWFIFFFGGKQGEQRQIPITDDYFSSLFVFSFFLYFVFFSTILGKFNKTKGMRVGLHYDSYIYMIGTRTLWEFGDDFRESFIPLGIGLGVIYRWEE